MSIYFADFEFSNDVEKVCTRDNITQVGKYGEEIDKEKDIVPGSIHYELKRFIEDCDLYRIDTTKGTFYVQKGVGGVLKMIKDTVMKKHINANLEGLIFSSGGKEKKPYMVFYNMCKTLRRTFRNIQYDFDDKDGLLNLFNMADFQAGWAKVYQYDPQDNTVSDDFYFHPLFDILMKSISGNNENFQSHLERCILKKRFYPLDTTIPAIVIADPGGTGKGLFIMNVLNTIFNGSVCPIDIDSLKTKGGNIELLGKAIVYIDEPTFTTSTYRSLKKYVANKYIDVRALYDDKLSVRNVAWVLISGNNDEPILPIGIGKESRRFSVITNGYDELRSMDIPYFIERTAEYAAYKQKTGRTADQYLSDNIDVFTDKDQCESWLSYVLSKHGYPVKGEKINCYRDNDTVEDIIENMDRLHYALDLLLLTEEFTTFSRTMFKNFYNKTLGYEPKLTNDFSLGVKMARYIKKHNLRNIWRSIEHSDGEREYYKVGFERSPATALGIDVSLDKIQRMQNIIFDKYKKSVTVVDDRLDVFHFTESELIEEIISEVGEESWSALSSEERDDKIIALLEGYQAGVPHVLPETLDHGILNNIIPYANECGEECYRIC